jgi:hypothetical protein
MILSAFTLFHVLISLVGIASGFVVLYGFLTSRKFAGWTDIFLWTTVATSVTGFMLPVHHFMPSHAVGLLSLIILGLAIYARRTQHLRGKWGKTFVITSVLAQYFNVFVLIVQLFQKVPALKELAPAQSEPPFQMAQLAVLIAFIAIGILATMRFQRNVATA